MSTITLHLPENLASELARSGRETSRTPEAVAEEMLRRMIALQRFDRLRVQVRQGADNRSPVSEDSVIAQGSSTPAMSSRHPEPTKIVRTNRGGVLTHN